MSHSHIPVRHLIRQLDSLRSQRQTRDRRPPWLVEFINAAADRFDPLDGVGRVGFDCRAAEGRWEVELYLGSTELVGGPRDGGSQPAAFSFDLLGLMRLFSQIERVSWSAQPGAEGGAEVVEAAVAIQGRVGERPLLLELRSLPPKGAGPGFRQYADGRRDAV